ncbi:MAG: spore germination protein, partial [Clostridia bacterium]|nr:spore germination protein [Clostridia bacterium]
YIIGISGMIMHIISLNSLGTDYTASLRRGDFQSLKDTLFRASWPKMLKRPSFNRNIIRKSETK